MSVRAQQFDAVVVRREQLSPHFVRVVLGGAGLSGFVSTGIPDEWVGLVVPGQFQSRYYTVRSWDGAELVLDIVVHDHGLVTEWAARPEIVGETVTVTEPKGSFALPDDAEWLLLVGDLTSLPAMARAASETGVPTQIWAEGPEVVEGYLPAEADVTWSIAPREGESDLARIVEGIDWPEGTGYFWMAGESSQMRAIRSHLMRRQRLSMGSDRFSHHVMGYWRGAAAHQQQMQVAQ